MKAVVERGVEEEVMVPEVIRVKAVEVVMDSAMQAAVEEGEAKAGVAVVPDPMVTLKPMAEPEMETPSGQGVLGRRHE